MILFLPTILVFLEIFSSKHLKKSSKKLHVDLVSNPKTPTTGSPKNTHVGSLHRKAKGTHPANKINNKSSSNKVGSAVTSASKQLEIEAKNSVNTLKGIADIVAQSQNKLLRSVTTRVTGIPSKSASSFSESAPNVKAKVK
jgi:hypothetical protein